MDDFDTSLWDEIQDMAGEIFDIEDLMLAEADVMSDPEFIKLGVCPLEALEADDTPPLSQPLNPSGSLMANPDSLKV